MKTKLLICASAAILAGPLHAAFLVAYDDASDPAYDTGWTSGSNGGYGFGAWSFFNLATFSTGQSNDNGTQAGPGIDVAGRAWMAQQATGWNGAIASRGIGQYATGEVFEIDVDFGLTTSPGQTVALLDGSAFCAVSANGMFLSIESSSAMNPVMTTVPYSDGGFTIRFTRPTDGTIEVFIRSLATNQDETYTLAYIPDGSGTSMTLGVSNPENGKELYANRMSLVSPVPEPSSLALVGLASLTFLARRRRADVRHNLLHFDRRTFD